MNYRTALDRLYYTAHNTEILRKDAYKKLFDLIYQRKNNWVRLIPCKCGNSDLEVYVRTDNKKAVVICPQCHEHMEGAGEKDARKNWNSIMKIYNLGEDDE